MLVSGLLLLISLAGLPVPRRAAAAATIRLTAREFSFEPAAAKATAGEITFVVTNEGVIEHTFVLEDRERRSIAEISVVAPGGTEQVRATLRPGAYTIFCRIPGHREAGMTAALTIGG